MTRGAGTAWDGAEMVGRPQHDDVAFVNAAAALWGEESPDIGYQARVFAQTSLPYRDPGSLPVWGRRNGSLSLIVQPGHDVDQDGVPVSAGFPFGVIPRLLLTWISTEAVRIKDPVLPLGDSLSDFMRQLGLVPTGGKVGTITRLREQMRRLFKATIAVRYSEHDPQTGHRPGRRTAEHDRRRIRPVVVVQGSAEQPADTSPELPAAHQWPGGWP